VNWLIFFAGMGTGIILTVTLCALIYGDVLDEPEECFHQSSSVRPLAGRPKPVRRVG